MSVYNIHVAGVKFNEGAADILAEMDISAELELRPEPENIHDKFAVGIYFEGNQVGYIPGYLSEQICKLIEEERIDVVLKDEGQKIEVHYDGGAENDV